VRYTGTLHGGGHDGKKGGKRRSFLSLPSRERDVFHIGRGKRKRKKSGKKGVVDLYRIAGVVEGGGGGGRKKKETAIAPFCRVLDGEGGGRGKKERGKPFSSHRKVRKGRKKEGEETFPFPGILP